jgi:hypothetical protein
MLNPTAGPAREKLSARTRLDETELQQARRQRLTLEEFEGLQRTGTLVIDDRRHRPLYFDGRFLAARDLTREQNYFLIRQSDLGRAGGSGIVNGLLAEMGSSDTQLRISAGHGVTPSGELVVLPNSLLIRLTDIAESQRLDAAFGLIRVPRESARNRSGLFVVALRPIEFSANPIASYPTSITGPRSVEDGEIIEGVAITLIPYPDDGAGDSLELRRARLARRIFVEGVTKGIPVGALPLAMIALDRGHLRWVDSFMVRREVGAEHGDILGLGFAPRALREAHLLQYEHHLAEVMEQRTVGGGVMRFPASEHFDALPPAGRMPAAAIDQRDFTQIFFPPEVDVDISIVPSDEIAALIEESLLLPPIDLTLEADEIESTSVLVLLPVARHQLRAIKAALTNSQSGPNSLVRPLRTAVPGLVAKRTPLQALIRMPRLPIPLPTPERVIDDTWRTQLGGLTTLWYVRRRNLSYKSEVVGASITPIADEVRNEETLIESVRSAGLLTRLSRVRSSATGEADLEVTRLLTSPRFTESRLLISSAVRELEESGPPAGETPPEEGAPKLDRLAVLKVGARFADPKLGEGISRLEAASPDLADERAVRGLASSKLVPELDEVARSLPPEEVKAFADAILEPARRGDTERVTELVTIRLKEIRR